MRGRCRARQRWPTLSTAVTQGQHTLVCSAAFQRTHHHPLNTTSTVCYYCVRPSGGSRHRMRELPRLSRNIHVRETKHSVPLNVELSAHIEKRRKHARLPPSGTSSGTFPSRRDYAHFFTSCSYPPAGAACCQAVAPPPKVALIAPEDNQSCAKALEPTRHRIPHHSP